MRENEAAGHTAGKIADVLRGRVIVGGLPPGTPLRDASFGTEFGVSRNTMREALRALQHEGLVEHHVNKGFVVRTLTPDDVLDIYVVRNVVEIRAIQESALCSSAALEPVGTAVENARRAVAEDEWSDVGTASLEFHQALVATLGSPSLNEFFAGIVARLRLAFAVMDNERAFQLPWMARDREIWELIRSGRREEAQKSMSHYLEESQRLVLDVVRQNAGRKPVPGRRS